MEIFPCKSTRKNGDDGEGNTGVNELIGANALLVDARDNEAGAIIGGVLVSSTVLHNDSSTGDVEGSVGADCTLVSTSAVFLLLCFVVLPPFL